MMSGMSASYPVITCRWIERPPLRDHFRSLDPLGTNEQSLADRRINRQNLPSRPFSLSTSVTTSGTCPIVGLVGGVGSGKTSLAKALAEHLDAVIVDGDAAGHRALADKKIQSELRNHFGNSIFNADGHIDRAALANRVFGTTNRHAADRDTLEQITHPYIAKEIQAEIKAAQRAGAPVIILDAAVLLETGWSRQCDEVVFVEASEECRQARLTSRPGSIEQWQQREALQLSLNEKRARCGAIVDNNGPINETVQEFEKFLSFLNPKYQERNLIPTP